MNIFRRLRDEEGVALVVVSGVLLVMALLTTAIATQSMRSSDDAVSDHNTKRALAAATAGLETATYRLNNVQPDNELCLSAPTPQPPSGGECAWSPWESLGNGASFRYVVTNELAAGAACSSVPGAPPPTGVERCITAQGIVNGVQRRVQTRVNIDPQTPPFMPVEGILGKKGVEIGNNGVIGGDVGSNVKVELGMNTDVRFVRLGPGGNVNGKKYTSLGVENRTAPYTTRPIPIEGTETNNNNAVIPSGMYSPGTRALRITSDLELPAGDYNFCRIEFDGGGLRAAPGATVRVFVDAPRDVRPESGCPPNGGNPAWGSIEGKNGVSIGQPDGNPVEMQIYILGWPPDSEYGLKWGRSAINVSKNNLDANAMIFAPDSFVHVAKNNANIRGGVVADEVYVKNNLEFNWDSGLTNVGYEAGAAQRRAWLECRPQQTVGGDPESGC